MIKYSLIDDAGFFNLIEENIDFILQRQPEILIQLIEHSCRIKAKIVELDEKENNIRALLNFGHTLVTLLKLLVDISNFFMVKPLV